MSLEETTGLIKSLADVVKNQKQLQNTALQKTADQLQTLSETVANLVQNLPSASPSLIQSNGLRLPYLIFPIYTGLEYLDRFITQLERILKSSNVPSQYWLTYLKQQSQQDARAYDAICEAGTANSLPILGPDSSKTSPAEFTKLYQTCVIALKTKRGKPRDQQLRDLLGAYYTMQQQPNESVADFAHRFTEIQHELEKLLLKIHRAADADGNDEVELIYSFSIKLKKSISKDLMSRDFKFQSLQDIISAAQRYELHSDSLPGKDELSAWEFTKDAKPEPVAVYSGPIQSRPSPSHFPQQQDFSHSNSSRNVPDSGRLRPNIIQMGLIFKIVLILLQVFLLVILVNPLLDLKIHQNYVTCLINLRGQLTTNVFTTVYINVRPVINASSVVIGLLAKLILLNPRPNLRVKLMYPQLLQPVLVNVLLVKMSLVFLKVIKLHQVQT